MVFSTVMVLLCNYYLIGEVTKHRAVQMSRYENLNLCQFNCNAPFYAPLLVCIITVL